MHQSDDFTIWQMRFAEERVRLLNALGEITAGGIVEDLQHIGATSIPEVLAAPCVDMGLAVWPFPLEAQHYATLESLGYAPVTGYGGVPEQRFQHATGDFQLFLAEAGSDEWADSLIIRDYVRHTESARQTFSRFKQSHRADTPEYQLGKARLFSDMLDAARVWWINTQGFAPVGAVAHELNEFEQPWYVSSGWAIDLFLGHVTRIHHDVDIVVDYTNQLTLRQYLEQRGWKMVAPFEGRSEPWPPHMRLELPRHQVHAYRDGAFIDCLLSDLGNGMWHYRREPTVIRQLDRAVLHTTDGIPYLAPELVLLFKSKNTSFNKRERGQDQIDFEAVHTHLDAERRAWLHWALLATEPTHPWVDQLR